MPAAPEIRLLEPAPGVLAFYAGRDGSRFAAGPNWVDEGAIGLGIASFALIAAGEAIVYDTGISLHWGRTVRAELKRRGIARPTVVLSHWHLDHVAGTGAFADCEVLAGERTAAHLARHREAIEAGELEGPPRIAPLVLPTRTFGGDRRIELGSGAEALGVELLAVDVHSDDAIVLWLPERGLLLCGDTMEDTVTFVDEPDHFDFHLRDLERLRRLRPRRILPNHGEEETIAAGGYPPTLIDATAAYVSLLREAAVEPGPASRPLRELLPELAGAEALRYFEPYEEVHRHNLDVVRQLSSR